ncbi:hypothetical protein SV7mr_38230 [Stieleria bergensis]|uniref:Uncharacterized protein n=1 Tax=Stieleria bergensis TaxID=2528025 RepID=A0A517SYR5_9BACT|nr:hypothetical protein SV7mr_38230 [Planctomycetes bacterium SV_7m_r]
MNGALSATEKLPPRCLIAIAALLLLLSGCGTTREHQATEQLLVSDAVDRSIQTLDFRPLTGRKVFLDTSYLRAVKGAGFVNADYVISGLRQQVLAAGCLLQDASTTADVIIEARVGTLGADNHLVTYGLPETNTLNSAASVIPGAPPLPVIPEIALARRDAREAAAKIVAFAYERETREPIWQSGIHHSVATAKDTWFLGMGPFRGGTIRDRTKLVGSQIGFGRRSPNSSPTMDFQRPAVDYTAETRFQGGWPDFSDRQIGRDMLASTPDESTEPAGEAVATTEQASDAKSGNVVQASLKSAPKTTAASTGKPATAKTETKPASQPEAKPTATSEAKPAQPKRAPPTKTDPST